MIVSKNLLKLIKNYFTKLSFELFIVIYQYGKLDNYTYKSPRKIKYSKDGCIFDTQHVLNQVVKIHA